MYTNGLKDRYGSPLLSLGVGDERYVRMNQIEFSHAKIEEKVESLGEHVYKNQDDIIDLENKNYHTNVVLNAHRKNEEEHFTEGEKKDFHNVVSVIKNNKNVFDENITEYTEYDNNIFPFSIEGGDNTYTSSVRYDHKHLPKGVIKSVSFYGRDTNSASHDSKTNGCYLLANVYKKDGSLVRSHSSINKVVVVEKQSSDTERPLNTWLFDGIPSIEEDEIIKFIPSPNGVSQKSNYYFGIRVDTTHTHDDCQIGGDGDFENNPLGVGNKHLAFAKFGGEFYYRNSKAKDLKPYEKTFLQSLYTKTSVKLFDNNVNNENLGVGSVKGWILERPYITNGIFNEIRWTSVGTVSWTENGQPKSTTGIAITLRDKYGKNIKTLFSNNTENFSAQGLKSFRFNEEFEIDDNIGSILIQTSTDGSTISTVAQCRVRVVGNAAKPNADGSETTNNNFVIHCEFWGNNVSLGGDILTTTQANSTFATKEELGGYVANETLGDYATNESLGGYVSKEEFDSLVEQTKQKQQYYDTWTNLKDGYFVDKAACYSFQLDKLDFVSGRIDRIEIPYAEGANAEGHLCVQFFDSSNSVIATQYSINTQKQDKTGNNVRGICEFEFMTFETPDEYSYVRFSMVANTTVVPTGNSGKQFRIMPIGYGTSSNKFLWNTNTNTKINNTGTRWTVLLSVLTRKIGKDTGITIRQYDWTPDVFCPINVTLSTAGNAFVAPTNGWIVSKSTQTTIAANSLTLNGIEIGASGSTAQADLQVLMRKGEFITATTAYNLVFFPCKSEQFDYRLENTHTKYDIWKGAVIYDENGESSVQDLYIPNASAWKSEVGREVIGSISTIVGEQAYDSNGYMLFNIQSQYIENGTGMFVQSTITSFDADLNALTNGTQMFGYSGLTQWNTNLPKLVTGDNMFMACGSLTSFTADLRSLSSGWYFLTNCTNLTDVSFVGGLDALTDGTSMFKGCSLNYISLYNILNALPTRNGNVIEITIADDVKDIMLEDLNWRGVTIPAYNSGNYYGFTHNGWNVRLTSRSGFAVTFGDGINPDDIVTDYDLSEAKNNITNVSEWGEQVGSNLNIVRVINKIAYNS